MLQVCISRFPCSCHVAFWEKIVIVTQHSSLGVLRDRSKEGFTEKAIVTLYGLFYFTIHSSWSFNFCF